MSPSEPTTETSAAAGPSTKPSPPTSIQLKEDSWSSFGHFLIAKVFANNDHDQLGHEGSTTLFHPENGEIDLDAKALLPDADVTYERYASSGPTENPYIAGIFKVRVPSHDLEPEATVVYAAQIDPATITIRKKAEVGRYGDGQSAPSIGALVGTPGDVVAWSADGTASAYDFATTKLAWSRPGNLTNSTFGSGGAVLDIESTAKAGGVDCPHTAIVDVVTGSDIFDADTFAMKVDEHYCGRLKDTVFPTVGLVALLYNPENKAGTNYYRPAAGYDFVHRQNLVVGPSTDYADERSTLVGVKPEEGENAFEVRDSLTGNLVYAMAREKADALNFRVVNLFDKQLFVETTDEKLVVDATNGQTVSKDWGAIPTAVADSWVLYSDGKFVRQ